MSELVAQNGGVDFQANTIVISDPKSIVSEVLFASNHGAQRRFQAELAAGRELGQELIPRVEIARAVTPEDAEARLDALHATGEREAEAVEVGGIVLEGFDASRDLTLILAHEGMFPRAYAAGGNFTPDRPTVIYAAQTDAILSVLAHNLRGH